MERQGVDIIHLEVGEPDFDVPSAVKKATIRALEQGATHYTHSMGDLELREAICRHYLDGYGIRDLARTASQQYGEKIPGIEFDSSQL